MKRILALTAIVAAVGFATTTALLLTSIAAHGVIINPMDYKDTEKAYNDYMELLSKHDVHITLPRNYTPASIRGLSCVKESIGRGEESLNIDCQPVDIGAIVENDSCQVAVCYPQILIDFPGASEPFYMSGTHGSGKIEADLRMINNDMHLDVRPMVKIIAEEDMSKYANADTVAFYEFDMTRHMFMDSYTKGIGIYLRKRNHPALLIRLMFRYNSFQDKDRYIREILDNIHFGDNPSETFVELEKKESGRPEFSFPTKYRMFTGILPDINDETLEEINRVKAWCEEHGMKELPRLDDAVLDALNRAKGSRQRGYTRADSIMNTDIPEEKKILLPWMCDIQAHFPGEDDMEGIQNYGKWIKENLRYPKGALAKEIEATVMVDFVVSSDGSIRDVAVNEMSRDVDESLKREAIRLIKSMPTWVPAKYKGKPVNTNSLYLVRFDLPKNRSKTDNQQPETTSIAEKQQAPEYIYDMKGVPVAPKFNGGSAGLAKWIQEHIQYPASAAKAKIEGRVIVEFLIDKNGTVTAPKVIRGINDSLNNEALRIIRSLPRWTPGYANGKPVKTKYTYPVTFRLAKAK